MLDQVAELALGSDEILIFLDLVSDLVFQNLEAALGIPLLQLLVVFKLTLSKR